MYYVSCMPDRVKSVGSTMVYEIDNRKVVPFALPIHNLI
jgi:hypothetical protein